MHHQLCFLFNLEIKRTVPIFSSFPQIHQCKAISLTTLSAFLNLPQGPSYKPSSLIINSWAVLISCESPQLFWNIFKCLFLWITNYSSTCQGMGKQSRSTMRTDRASQFFLEDLGAISSHENHVNDAEHLLDDKEPPFLQE